MAQPLAEIGDICRRHDVILYVDATATLGGMEVAVDRWKLDAVSAGLQKCLSGPPGSSPVTFNERVVEIVQARKHIEAGIRPDDAIAENGPVIQSNYFDLPMLMDYWSEARLNHHTEATSMLYAARECARIALAEGLEARFARHRLASTALTTGLATMGLTLFGDQKSKMPNVTGVEIPDGIDGERVRAIMLNDFGIEIGTSFGPSPWTHLADRDGGLCLPQGERAHLPRRARGGTAPVRLQDQAGLGRGCGARGLSRGGGVDLLRG
jgi:(S)-ureidoglycine-glyoxylate aminotransferase